MTNDTPTPLCADRADRANRDNRSPLDDVREWLARYIVTTADGDLDILTLWIAHTWLTADLPTSPRLQIDSIAPGSGKTTVLEHIGRLSLDPSHMSSISSAALLVRMLAERPRTLLLDEVDRALDPRADLTKDLIAVLNSGYRRGATRPVLVPSKGGDWEAKEMPTYAPVALAGNSPRLPDDTRSRLIRIVLMPDVDGRAEETDWEDMDIAAAELHDALEAWADSVRAFVRECRPTLPEGCVGRNRERWAPLLRIALAAGGEWPDRVINLIAEDMEEQELMKAEGLQRMPPAVLLMRDIYEVWRDDEAFIPTRNLVDRLILENAEAWSERSDYGKDLTPQRLGRMLATNWRIHTWQRPDGDRARGYRRQQFADAWRQVVRMGANVSNGTNGTNGSHSHPYGKEAA